MRRQTYDQEKVNFNLLKYTKHGHTFELVVDPDLAISIKASKVDSKEEVLDMLKAQNVFFDAKKGVLAGEEELRLVFKTLDVYEVAKKMLVEGELQLTSEYREKLREEKRKKIVNLIHKTTINPQTNVPHPHTRIENAMNEAKVKINEFQKAQDQVADIIHKLKPIIPIKKDDTTLLIEIPMNYAASIRGLLPRFGDLKDENWTGSGMSCKLIVPSGIRQEVMDELNNKTKGEIIINIER